MPVNVEAEARAIMRLYSEARFKEGLDRAIALHRAEPRLAATNYCVGHGLGATNRQHEALPFLRKAVQIEPRNADFLIRYSRALLDTGHIREAESNLMRARDINPKLSIIPWTLAVFYSSINRFDKAVRHFEEVMKIGLPEPVANGVRLDWAQALVEVGRTEEAAAILRPLLNDDKARAAALGRLSAFAAFPEGSPEYALLDDEIRRHANDGEKRFVLLSAKARCRAAMKDYEGEYALIAESNAARAGRDMVPSFRYVVDGMIAGFTPQTIAELGELAALENFRPIYVVGLPRSGTTLTEKILSSHSKVGGAGELSILGHLQFGLMNNRPFSDFLAVAKQVGSKVLRERLHDIEATMAFLCPGKDRVVDKLPHNFLHCGAIAAFFPGAHIIHVFRNPADNFLSGYKARLLAAHSYFDSPERFLPYFAEYRRLMEHWYKVIPDRIHPLHYEKLVTEPKDTIAGLLSFCGLEWEEDCLYPERGEQRIATASLVQARNPINARSVGNWKRYQSHLQVIQDQLGEGLFPAA